MKAILIRVGIDQSYGHWNAPCNPDNRDYLYVPIPEPRDNHVDMQRYYRDRIVGQLNSFADRYSVALELPEALHSQRMHLDPDFDHLTYGDSSYRGRRLLDFNRDDVVVFYASLRSIHPPHQLIYALIGLYVVESIVRVAEIESTGFDENAHTRYLSPVGDDVVVIARPGVSGRFRRYIPIGEFRDRSYRVRRELLHQWGDLSVNDGWIQRSVVPPLFLDAPRFMGWLGRQQAEVIATNDWHV